MNESKKATIIVAIIWAIMLTVIVLMAGCATVCYIRIGPQKLDKIQIILESQEADPNIPAGLIKVGGINL